MTMLMHQVWSACRPAQDHFSPCVLLRSTFAIWRNLYAWTCLAMMLIAGNVWFRHTGAWYLSFPLAPPSSSTPSSTSATINTIFDHAMTSPYAHGQSIIAYTGAQGSMQYGEDLVTGTAATYGFKNSTGSPFIVDGHYAGGGNTLCAPSSSPQQSPAC